MQKTVTVNLTREASDYILRTYPELAQHLASITIKRVDSLAGFKRTLPAKFATERHTLRKTDVRGVASTETLVGRPARRFYRMRLVQEACYFWGFYVGELDAYQVRKDGRLNKTYGARLRAAVRANAVSRNPESVRAYVGDVTTTEVI